MGLEQVSEVKVRSANGVVKRPVYLAIIKFERRKYEVTAAGSDRNNLEMPDVNLEDLLGNLSR